MLLKQTLPNSTRKMHPPKIDPLKQKNLIAFALIAMMDYQMKQIAEKPIKKIGSQMTLFPIYPLVLETCSNFSAERVQSTK